MRAKYGVDRIVHTWLWLESFTLMVSSAVMQGKRT